MKKLYAFLVMAIYLISLVPMAFAQEGDSNEADETTSQGENLDQLIIDIRAFILASPYENTDACVNAVKDNYDENEDFVDDAATHFCTIWRFGPEEEKTRLDNLISNIRALVMQNPHDNIDACVGDVQNVYLAENAEFVEDTAKHFCTAWSTLTSENDEAEDETPTVVPSPDKIKDGTAVLPVSKWKGKKLGQLVDSVDSIKEERGALISRLAKLDKEIRRFVFETEHVNVDACVGDVQNKFLEEPADYVKHFALYHCNIWAMKEAKDNVKENAKEKVSGFKSLPAYDLQKAMNVIKNNPELLEKLTSLSQKQKEVMAKHFTRARYKWCLENPEECKETLKKLTEFTPIKKKVVEKKELVEARRRYIKAKEAYLDELEEMRARKARFFELKKLKEEGSTEYSETEMVDTAKDYLLRSIDMLKNHLTTIEERVRSSESLTEDEINEKVKEIEEGLAKLDDLRARVDAATTKEELTVVTKELKDFWKEYRLVTKGQALELMQDKMKDILIRTNVLERKLDQMLQGAELRGIEIPEEVNALINSFSEQIEKARSLYTESRDIKNKATKIRKAGFDTKEAQEEFNNLIVESNKKLQEARDAVADAHKTLAEIIRELVKSYNGKLPETETTPEEVVSQAEAEESAEAGIEA